MDRATITKHSTMHGRVPAMHRLCVPAMLLIISSACQSPREVALRSRIDSIAVGLEDANRLRRVSSLSAVRETPGLAERLANRIETLVRDDDNSVRVMAALTLTRAGAAGVEALLRLTYDSLPRTRATAALALGETLRANAQVDRRLTEMALQDPSSSVADAAQDARFRRMEHRSRLSK